MTTDSDPFAGLRETITKNVTEALAPVRASLDKLQQGNTQLQADIVASTEALKARAAASTAPTTPTTAATTAAAAPVAQPSADAPAVAAKRLDEMTPAEQKAAALAALPSPNATTARLSESLTKAAEPRPVQTAAVEHKAAAIAALPKVA